MGLLEDIRRAAPPRRYETIARNGLEKKIDLADKEARKNRVITGPGIIGMQTPHGKTMRNITRTFGWGHPFAVQYYGIKSQISPGTVNGLWPTIDGKDIRGDSKTGVIPFLKMQDFHGAASWVVIEVTRQKPTKVNPQLVIAKLEIKHVQKLNDQDIDVFFGGALGFPDMGNHLMTRYPLARIENAQLGNGVFQIGYFNLQYYTKDVNGGTRHYFSPA